MITGDGPPRVGYSIEMSRSLLRCASWSSVVGMTPTGDSSPSLGDAALAWDVFVWLLAHAATANAARAIRNFLMETSIRDRMTSMASCKLRRQRGHARAEVVLRLGRGRGAHRQPHHLRHVAYVPLGDGVDGHVAVARHRATQTGHEQPRAEDVAPLDRKSTR